MNFTGDQESLIPIIESALTRDSMIGATLTSFDSFVQHGINQIASQVFEMSFEKDAKDTVERDPTIIKYKLDITIDSVNIANPMKYDVSTQQTSPMFPNEALLRDLTLASGVYVSATMIARAYHQNGTVSVERTTIDNAMICKLPTMVKSKMCNTYNRSNEALIHLEEDPSDLGGYFVIKGNQYIIINTESMKYNESREFINEGHKNQLCRADIISKAGDAYENSYICALTLLNNHSIAINMGMAGFKEIEIPFFMFFRALGVYSAKEIISYITYSFDESDTLTKQMMDILEKALTNQYPEMNNLFKTEFPTNKGEVVGSINTITNQSDVLLVLTRCIVDYDNQRAKLRISGEEDKLNIERFLQSKLLYVLDQKFLTHVGLTEADRKKKAAFLGHMIHRMLLVHLGVFNPTDRDSYKNKRINDAGVSYSRIFKTQFNFAVVQKLKRQFMRDFTNNSFADINLQTLFKTAIKPEDFEKALMTAIVSGDKTLTVKQVTFKNRLSSQQLHHKNKLNVITTLRSIDTPNKSNSAKSSERAITLRQVHPTGTGYICGITSADTGAKVGMSKQLSVSADITAAGSSEVLKDIVRNDKSIIPILEILKDTTVITKHNLHKVFVNGDWLGCVDEFAKFLDKYRIMRRNGELNMYTTISHNIIANEIHLWVDSGRLIRPLLVVYNNMKDKNYSHDKFKQWIKLTDMHIKKLKSGEIDIDDLVRDGVIEYISPEEHENCYIAFEFDRFKQHINDPLHRFTHVDIPQGNMGLVALTSVFANHNQAARIVFQTNQVKQTNSWSLKNWPFVAHKDLYHQIYNEDPLVTTFAYRHIPPMGMNAIVAITVYGGFNQEDSLIVNRSSVDRGMFDAAHFTSDKVEIEQNEIVGKPDPAITSDIKSYCNYEKLVNGIVPVGTFVQEGDCLVGKVAKLQKGEMKDPNIIYTDRSMVYRKKEPAYIWKVIHGPNYDDRELIKIVFKTFRSTEIGCKFCVPETNEVLTDNGWKMFKDLDGTEKICSLVDNEKIEYVEPIGIYHFKHEGEMVRIKTQQLNSTTTLNHKLYVKLRDHKEYDLIEAKDVYKKRISFKKDGFKDGDYQQTIKLGDTEYDMDAYLDLLGAWISDGWLHNRSNTHVVITFRKQRKMDFFKSFTRRLGVKTHHYDKNNYIIDKNIYKSLEPFNLGALNKYLPEFVWNLNQKQARVLLDALIQGDGHVTARNQISYSTSSQKLANDVQRLALHAGYTANISISTEAGTISKPFPDGHIAVTSVNNLRVAIIKTRNCPTINTSVQIKNGNIPEIIQYNGIVSCVEVPSHVFYMREDGVPHWTGNSSRAGQKGVTGFLYDETDMPTSKSGMKCDIIFNPLSLITRMTTGVIFEGMMAKLAAHTGTCPEATMFKKMDTDNIANMLESYGFNRNGTERLYNGMTGRYMDAEIFFAPIMYQTLQKYTIDTVYANSISPTDAMTRQPLHGKKLNGASKLGAMETACMSVSSMNFLSEKITDHSDGSQDYICANCGSRQVIANEERNMYSCNNCKDLANIQKFPSSHSSRLFTNELGGMSVGIKYHSKKPCFEILEEEQ